LSSTARLAACGPLERAFSLLHKSGGRVPVGDLARISGLTERTLRRQVEARVGLSVEVLASMLRFQRTLRLLSVDTDSPLSLAEAALESGHADQAHMTRELCRQGGFTPHRRPLVSFAGLPLPGLAESLRMALAFGPKLPREGEPVHEAR
jgi:transcriptional regulator GlxA family with amidase domain